MPTLEQKIRKHNPSLQELTFGCEVKAIRGGERFFVLKKYVDVCRKEYLHLHSPISPAQIGIGGVEEFEIIGHPIKLRHVLIAIEKSGHFLNIDSQGMLTGTKLEIEVDLSLPFSQWSPEVHEFINKLID